MKYRHGDIPLHATKEVSGKVIKHDGSFVLALGEATGHHHVITVEKPADMEIRQTADGYVLVLKSNGTLTHQEHGAITVAPGTYRVGREVEYNWFSKTKREVID